MIRFDKFLGSFQNINVSIWQPQGQPQQYQHLQACLQSHVTKHSWNDRTGSEVKLPEIVTSATTNSFFTTLPISQPEQPHNRHFQSPSILTRQTFPPPPSHSSSQRNPENFSRGANVPAITHQLPQMPLSHFKHPSEYHQVKITMF